MSQYAVNLNNGETDEKGQFRLLGKLFTQSGVIEQTALTVSALGTPGMAVQVSGSAANDNAVFITTNGDTYHGWNTDTAGTQVNITSNNSGNTMLDAVVAYIDTAAGSASANNPAGLKFTTVRGAAANTAPTSAAISSAVGGKPYLTLANVTVGNGVSSINSGNITDVRIQAWLQQPANVLSPSAITLAYAARTTDFSTSSSTAVQVTNLSANVTVPSGGRKIKITVHASS